MTRRLYCFPHLIAGADTVAPGFIDDICHAAIRAAWREGKRNHHGSDVKAARNAAGNPDTTPADLNAAALALVKYNRLPWPTEEERGKPIEWLWYASGPEDQRGTYWDARVAARPALEGVLSILVDVPIEHEADEAAIMQTLHAAGWRLPRYQHKRVAQRFARYIANKLVRKTFVPVNGAAA